MSTTLLRYLGVRLALIIPTAWILMTLVFVLMRGSAIPSPPRPVVGSRRQR